jgi:hypothetical protein
LWRADTTTAVDRKRLLRLAVTADTVTVDRIARRVDVVLLWTGGATSTHSVPLPPIGLHSTTDAAVIDRIRELSARLPDHAVASELNALGLRTRTGKEWTYERVFSMRKQYGLATGCPIRTGSLQPRADGRLSAKAVAKRLGITSSLVQIWVQHGILTCDQRCPYSKQWIQLTDADIARLDGSAEVSGLPTLTEVAEDMGVERDAVWARVRRGDYIAFRTTRGCGQWEWRLKARSATEEVAPSNTVGGNRDGTEQYG